MRYIAGRHLNTGERQIDPGEEVPEAAEWARLDAYVNDGSVILILEDGEGPPIGVNPSDVFITEDDAMARAVGPRWLGASDNEKAEPADASSEEDDEDESTTAPAVAPEEPEPEVKPEPVKKTAKKSAPAKRPTKRV